MFNSVPNGIVILLKNEQLELFDGPVTPSTGPSEPFVKDEPGNRRRRLEENTPSPPPPTPSPTPPGT